MKPFERRITGMDGAEWLVREVRLPPAGASDGARLPASPGCVLRFECEDDIRSCGRYPADWRDLSDELLWQLCEEASER